jgi:hypothetical protein
MKKLFLVVAIAATVGLTSCKKDHTCTCVVTGTTLPVVIPNSSKKDAKATCDLARTTYQIADPAATCTLD